MGNPDRDALRRKFERLHADYFRDLPTVALSRCPFTREPSVP